VSVSIGELERVAAGGWRAPEQAALGDWLLRAAGGFTGRANSALAVGDPGLPLAAAITEVSRWYRARGLPPMVAVPYPPGQPRSSAIDRFLGDEMGWPVRPGAAMVMTADPGEVAARAAAAGRGAPDAGAGTAADAAPGTAADAGPGAAADMGPGVEIAAEPDDGWLALYRFRGRRPPPMARRLLMSAPWQAFASVREAGDTLAIGRVAVAGDWAGLTAVEVDPRYRRRGLGSAVTAALAAAAAARGVAGLYLQVEDDNGAARALYRRAGFADHHGYHYRVAPAVP
jgi:N-acetylglutamate synthase